jgi:O-antigen ligase
MQPISGSPLMRALVIVIPGLLVAFYLATQIGSGDAPIAIYFLIGVVVLIAVKFSTKYVRLEALVLGILLFGYIVGQSGFGHFSLSPRKGIYLGEVGLVICLGAMVARLAFTRERIIPKQPLAWAILALIAVGTSRFVYDFRNSVDQIVVVRDFATIYYAAFFFIAFNICRHARSRMFLQNTVAAALICSIFVCPVFFVVPSLYDHFLIHRQPFIAPRGDLTGSFMGFACILFYLNSRTKRHWIRWTLLSFAAFLALILPLSRATFLGFTAAVVLLMLAGQPAFLLRLAVFTVIGTMILTPVVLAMRGTGEATYATMLREKILSVVEPFGNKRFFASEVGEVSEGNNEFRATWWKSVIDETNEKSPLVGLGFGYDLAKRFLRSYTAPLDPFEFDARSPHSILLTMYGRMGLIGFLSFAVVVFFILKSSLRCAAAIRRRKTGPIDMALWCGVVAILITSCFGVMLEGPMAAIVFWSLLGMASYREWERLQPAPEPSKLKISQGPLMRPAPSPVASRIA